MVTQSMHVKLQQCGVGGAESSDMSGIDVIVGL